RPKGFQGGLPFPYHVGGTDYVRVHLKTSMDYQVRKIWNVISRIDGDEEKDRWVIMGNHRDAWVFGAVDPNSGTTAMLEAARAFGSLLKKGWKPRRTIVMASWDGEEYGLLGSTEWAEENAAELQQKAVAYLNMDAAVSGPNFGASSVPSLWKLIRGATRDVKDPKTGKSVYQQWQDRSRENRPEGDTDMREARIAALGSGSDYTPFLQHLGVASTDMSFNGDYGVYHSAAAQLWGTLAMRLADADGLPFDYTDYATQVRDFFTEAMRLARIRNLAASVDDKAMTSAIDDFAREAERVEKDRQDAVRKNDRERLAKINDALMLAERQFIDVR